MARPKAPPKEKKPIITTKAPDVEALARELIEADHIGLKDAGIKCGFFGDGKKQKDFGRVVLVPEPLRVLLERPNVQFVLVVSPAHWNRMDDMQRRQALDALLCGISFDGKMPRREKPDAAIYRANIMRYKGRGEALEQVFRGIQLTLPEINSVDAVAAVPDNVDPETGEIKPDEKPAQKPRRPKTDGFGVPLPEKPSVTLSMGETTAVITPETGKTIDKLLKAKRGAKATGPQQPTAGA
jgi:hypothetical protein